MNFQLSQTNSVWLAKTAGKLNLQVETLLEVILQMLREHSDEDPDTSLETWITGAGQSQAMSTELVGEIRATTQAAEEAINATRHYINLIERHRK